MSGAVVGGAGAVPDVLTTAADLRWMRPDLTRDLAEHAAERAEAVGDQGGWLLAAGWSVHGSPSAARVDSVISLVTPATTSLPASVTTTLVEGINTPAS